MSAASDHNAAEFLKVADDFKLGMLPTEQQHPLTLQLADLSRHDPLAAIHIMKKIDEGVAAKATAKVFEMYRLRAEIQDTIANGNRVFFYGCGATGRLSLSLEHLWRFVHKGTDKAEQVRGFMSGGDLALIHSIESFEDHPEWGAQQVRDNGFGPGDLMVAITEGGETPSVIGAVEEAALLSFRKPYFLYCNPTDILTANIERSRRVIKNPGIDKIELFTGPMGLSGSTRLQATSIQQEIAGASLFDWTNTDLKRHQAVIEDTDYSFLRAFIEREADIYRNGGYVTYETNRYGVTLMTDTTERAPTFSLKGFENQHDAAREASWSYLCLPHAKSPLGAWRALLGRNPIPVEWPVLNGVASGRRLLGFDFSMAARDQRKALTNDKAETFAINREGDNMVFALGDLRHEIDVSRLHPLSEHLLLKSLMNIHSTLVMGRMGRFESNVMIWVKPSNNKLIDRSIRYVQYMQEAAGQTPDAYEAVCHRLFEEVETLKPGEPVVLKTLENLRLRPIG